MMMSWGLDCPALSTSHESGVWSSSPLDVFLQPGGGGGGMSPCRGGGAS